MGNRHRANIPLRNDIIFLSQDGSGKDGSIKGNFLSNQNFNRTTKIQATFEFLIGFGLKLTETNASEEFGNTSSQYSLDLQIEIWGHFERVIPELEATAFRRQHFQAL